jgi:hypothetical protein
VDNESNKRFTMLTVEVKVCARTCAADSLADSLAARAIPLKLSSVTALCRAGLPRPVARDSLGRKRPGPPCGERAVSVCAPGLLAHCCCRAF